MRDDHFLGEMIIVIIPTQREYFSLMKQNRRENIN